MPESTPQTNPGYGGQSTSSGGGASAPSLTPAPGAAGGHGDCGCGGAGSTRAPGTAGSGGVSLTPNLSDAAPSLTPASEGSSGGITAWLNNKRITALWGINQNRNSWVHVDGIGWRKLANNSDSAIVALTMLGSNAREKNSPVNYREESDGMIHEMYVF